MLKQSNHSRNECKETYPSAYIYIFNVWAMRNDLICRDQTMPGNNDYLAIGISQAICHV